MVYKIFKLGEVFKVVFYKRGHSAMCDDFELGKSSGAQNLEKLDSNLSRAKSRIRELALCNDWSHFVTLTLNSDKADRYDLDGFIKKLGYWIRNYELKYFTRPKYLLIPEQHKNGAWHMHGLMNGLAKESLIINKKGYLDMPYYQSCFGFISLDPIRDKKRIASYITKYVSKALQATAIELCKHSFYHSKGLKGAELVHEDITAEIPENVWTNDFVGIQMFDGYEELTKFIKGLKPNET